MENYEKLLKMIDKNLINPPKIPQKIKFLKFMQMPKAIQLSC